ncbi:hypothetical protein Tco_1011564 [Tanacetum coccineum]
MEKAVTRQEDAKKCRMHQLCDAVEAEASEDIGAAKDAIEQVQVDAEYTRLRPSCQGTWCATIAVLFGSNKEDASASAEKILETKDESEVGVTEKGFLNGRGVKEKEVSGQHGLKPDTSNTKQNKDDEGVNKVTNSASFSNVNLDQNVSHSVDMFEASCRNTNDVNTDNVNMETPLESNKGEDINSNANVEPTASASLSASMADVVVPLESIRVVSERFANSAYGFFLGKRVAYHVVANYFSSKDGLDATLENGPWFIRNNPFIPKKWNPNVILFKEDVSNVPVWVKLHGVHMTAFSEDGLSVIDTKFSTPLMLDSYTSNMCMQSWGISSYARAMIELRADVELKDTIVVAMPKLVGEGFYMCTIRVEYECKPPRCSSCKVFGHVLNECPKKIIPDAVKNLNNPRQATRGVSVGPNVCFKSTKQVYKPVSNKNGASTSGKGSKLKWLDKSSSNTPIISKIDKLERQIIDGKLMFVDDDGNPLVSTSYVDSEGEVDVVFDKTTNIMPLKNSKGGNDRGYSNNSLLEQ